MVERRIEPQLGLASYSCPHCGAIAQQTWFKSYIEEYKRDEQPALRTYREQAATAVIGAAKNASERKKREAFFKRARRHLVFEAYEEYGPNSTAWLVNATVGHCFSCQGFSIWVGDKLAYPERDVAIQPHEDMPPEIIDDFREAAAVVQTSPRGASALLRLCIQKLVGHLGANAENLNNGIGQLVQNGLDTRIQKALDVVRVTGNNAVHPGNIDLKDNKNTALHLFDLVNIIVQATISTQKKIESLYETLPQGALEAIDKRDKT